MPPSLDRLQDKVDAMERELGVAKTWMATHEVDCGHRYRDLRDSMARHNRLLMTATLALGAIAVGLKSKFGEELLRLLGLL